MKPNAHNGERILHVDGSGYAHTGIVVGESDDGHAVYIQSDKPTMPKAVWHFTIRKPALPTLLKNAKLIS